MNQQKYNWKSYKELMNTMTSPGWWWWRPDGGKIKGLANYNHDWYITVSRAGWVIRKDREKVLVPCKKSTAFSEEVISEVITLFNEM